LSIGKPGVQGAKGASGAPGPSGSPGPSGQPGYSEGLSASDFYYTPSTLPDNVSFILITRTNAISELGWVSSPYLNLTSNSLVQVTSTLVIQTPVNSNSSQETGFMDCQVLYGAHGAALSTFTSMSWNRTNISEPNTVDRFDGQLVMISAKYLDAGSYDFAVTCLRSGGSPDAKVTRMDLNAVAIGSSARG
jgi:hypothetical protein